MRLDQVAICKRYPDLSPYPLSGNETVMANSAVMLQPARLGLVPAVILLFLFAVVLLG